MGGSAADKLTLGCFICFAHLFQLDLDETSFLRDESELSIIGGNHKPLHEKKLQ